MISMTAAMFLIQGCGEPGELDAVEQWIADTQPLDLNDAELVRQGAQHSDPLSMLVVSTLPVLELRSALESGQTSCPRLIDASDPATGLVDWRIEGGCAWEDEGGKHRLEGRIVARGDANGTELVYDGVRRTTVIPDLCNDQEIGMAVTGVVSFPFAYLPLTPDAEEPDGSDDGPPDTVKPRTDHYDIHILIESSDVNAETCLVEKTGFAYDVTVDRTFEQLESGGDADLSDIQGSLAMLMQTREPAQASWQTVQTGAWLVSADGYGATAGDAECTNYVTGTLRLEAGGDVAVLQPEAPASCLSDEQDACTAWTLNGKPQPEVCGFVGLTGCSAGPDAPPPWTAMILLVGGLIWQSRRRRQRA
jgi:MYXO-CTERM domain-containing protein